MTASRRALVPVLAILALSLPASRGARADAFAAPLPGDVKAVWDAGKAHRESTPTRERVSLNGLWRWQPADAGSRAVPEASWGYFKVPGCWPGITDYMQKDDQTVFTHPAWAGV